VNHRRRKFTDLEIKNNRSKQKMKRITSGAKVTAKANIQALSSFFPRREN